MSEEPGQGSTHYGRWAAGFAIGLAVGLAIGAGLKNIGAGIAIGAGLAVAFGITFQGMNRPHR